MLYNTHILCWIIFLLASIGNATQGWIRCEEYAQNLRMFPNSALFDSWQTPFSTACSEGHLELIKLIIATEKPVDLMIGLTQAIMNKQVETVNFILTETKLPPTATALMKALTSFNQQIVKLFLAHPGYDQMVRNGSAFAAISNARSTKIAQLLFEDGRADPAAGGNLPLKLAYKSRNTDLIKLLLSDPRVARNLNWFDVIPRVLDFDEDRTCKMLSECNFLSLLDDAASGNAEPFNNLHGFDLSVEQLDVLMFRARHNENTMKAIQQLQLKLLKCDKNNENTLLSRISSDHLKLPMKIGELKSRLRTVFKFCRLNSVMAGLPFEIILKISESVYLGELADIKSHTKALTKLSAVQTSQAKFVPSYILHIAVLMFFIAAYSFF